jgi:fatty acid desaturase
LAPICNNSVYIYAHFIPCLALIFVTIQFTYMLYGSCLALILFHVSQMSTSGSEDSSDDDEHFFLSFKVVLN